MPLQADVNFNIEKAAVPLNMQLVMQIDSQDPNEGSSFIRVPFNLIKYDWNGSNNFSTSVISGAIPQKIKRIVIYFYNVDEREIKLKVNNFKLYQIHGEGIQVISKAAI